MKRLLQLHALSATIVMTVTPAMALQFKDQEQADAYFAREKRVLQKIRDDMEKGKTDDEALREAVRLIYEASFSYEEAIGNPIPYTQNLMKKVEMPQERQIKVFEDMIRESVSVIEKADKIISPIRVIHFLTMLESIPDYNMLPILKECAVSKDERVRNITMQTTEKIIANLKKENKPDEMTKLTTFLTEIKQAEKEKGEN